MRKIDIQDTRWDLAPEAGIDDVAVDRTKSVAETQRKGIAVIGLKLFNAEQNLLETHSLFGQRDLIANPRIPAVDI